MKETPCSNCNLSYTAMCPNVNDKKCSKLESYIQKLEEKIDNTNGRREVKFCSDKKNLKSDLKNE